MILLAGKRWFQALLTSGTHGFSMGGDPIPEKVIRPSADSQIYPYTGLVRHMVTYPSEMDVLSTSAAAGDDSVVAQTLNESFGQLHHNANCSIADTLRLMADQICLSEKEACEFCSPACDTPYGMNGHAVDHVSLKRPLTTYRQSCRCSYHCIDQWSP